MQKKLSDVITSFEHETVAADGCTRVSETEIGGILIQNLVFDSREVTPGTLFFALPGTHINGNDFIPAAIEHGANAVVFQGDIPHDIQIETAKAVAKRVLEAEIADPDRKSV